MLLRSGQYDSYCFNNFRVLPRVPKTAIDVFRTRIGAEITPILKEYSVDPFEIARLQQYLRNTFANNQFKVKARSKLDDSVEVYLGDEFMGVIYKDEDEGEISYALQISILEMDLPRD